MCVFFFFFFFFRKMHKESQNWSGVQYPLKGKLPCKQLKYKLNLKSILFRTVLKFGFEFQTKLQKCWSSEAPTGSNFQNACVWNLNCTFNSSCSPWLFNQIQASLLLNHQSEEMSLLSHNAFCFPTMHFFH